MQEYILEKFEEYVDDYLSECSIQDANSEYAHYSDSDCEKANQHAIELIEQEIREANKIIYAKYRVATSDYLKAIKLVEKLKQE